MTRNPWFWITTVAVLAGLGVGGYFLYEYLNRPEEVVKRRDPPKTLQREPIPIPPVRFKDGTKDAGIRFTHNNGLSGKKLLAETMGAGVVVFDFDADGWQDILFVNSCAWPGESSDPRQALTTMALYRNKGDGTFEDVTAKMGLNIPMFGMGATAGDYDNDGYPDLFISAIGQQRLFHNEKGKGFREVTEEAGIDRKGGPRGLPDLSREEFLASKAPIPFGTSCTFLDYDGDGKLDLFLCQYVTWSPSFDLNIKSSLRGGKRAFVQPRDFNGAQCRLFRNIDGKHFVDVSKETGIEMLEKETLDENARLRPVGKSLGVIVCDPDGDGWPDIIVANDTVRNFFFHNVAGPDGKRRFKERGKEIGAAYADEGVPRGGMGIDWGEYLPGRFAAVIANFATEPNTFLSLENADPRNLLFQDAAVPYCIAGPSRNLLKFAAIFFDYDLDGRLDLLTCNGHIEPEIADIQTGQTYAQPAQLFWNTGNLDRLYEPATPKDVGEDLFMPMVGRSAAFADFNKNGHLDVVLTANGGPARLLRNQYQGDHRWVRLVLRGDGKRSNHDAIGAQVTIEAGGQVMRRQVVAGRGYLGQSELPLTVGIGKADKVERVTVRWPCAAKHEEKWENLAPGKTYELEQGKSGK